GDPGRACDPGAGPNVDPRSPMNLYLKLRGPTGWTNRNSCLLPARPPRRSWDTRRAYHGASARPCVRDDNRIAGRSAQLRIRPSVVFLQHRRLRKAGAPRKSPSCTETDCRTYSTLVIVNKPGLSAFARSSASCDPSTTTRPAFA